MNTRIGALILLLPVFFISGCDGGQDSPADDKDETTETKPVTPAKVPELITDQGATAAAESEEMKTEAESVQTASSTGKEIYQNSCASCHKIGVANAPKLGDADAWEPRIAKGKEALYNSALNGVSGTAMVARGGCGSCSDEELKAAVDYMVSSVE